MIVSAVPTGSNIVLVTGGAGFVGSHACKAFAARGFLPVTYDNLCRGDRNLVRWGPLIEADLDDRAALRAAIRTHKPLAIAHFAAFAYVEESIRQPAMYWRNNVAGSLNLLEVMAEEGVKNLIFSSSCATYGIHDFPITERMSQDPINPYGATKLAVERMIHDFARRGGLDFTILRYFNAAGCDPAGETGEIHDPEPHVIPRALLAAAGHFPSFDVFGTDYPTADGSCLRDYVHVSDLAEAHVSAVDRMLAGGDSDSFNLGIGKGYSVLDIIGAVERVTKRRVPVRFSGRRPGDPPALVADASKAGRALGFSPRYPTLEQMIQTAWNWFGQRLHMKV